MWEGWGGGSNSSASASALDFVTMLPLSMKNQRKVPHLPQPPDGLVPIQIKPIDEATEAKLIHSLFEETNTSYGLTLGTEPECSRSSDPMTVTDSGRVVLVGAPPHEPHSGGSCHCWRRGN